MSQHDLQKLYLNPAILNWGCHLESSSMGDQLRVSRSYDTLEHARTLITSAPSEFQMADAVMNLKRAINSRLKLLDEIYQFSKHATMKKVGALERLEIVGLARPFLIRQLFELRNDIEHNDSPPPLLSRLKELVDITWYFLRSTDSAASKTERTLLFEAGNNLDDDCSLWLEVKPFASRIDCVEISGWLDPTAFSEQEGWQISLERLEEPPRDVTKKGSQYFRDHGRRHTDQRFVVGTLSKEDESFLKLSRLMFSLN